MSVNIDRINQVVTQTRKKMRVTKVVATRAIKTKSGDFFCGMSAAWETLQDDAGGAGSDMELNVSDTEVSGMTIEEARISQTLLALEVTQGALRAALTEEAISLNEYELRIKSAKKNTLAHLSRLLPPDVALKQIDEITAK